MQKVALNYGESVAVLLPTHWENRDLVILYLQESGVEQFDFSQDRQHGKPNYGLLNKYLSEHG